MELYACRHCKAKDAELKQDLKYKGAPGLLCVLHSMRALREPDTGLSGGTVSGRSLEQGLR